MHHVILERWSRQQSPIHARDARFKLIATIVFLVLVATTRPSAIAFAAYFAALLAAILAARIPLRAALWRAGSVLPFSLVFAIVSIVAGDPARAGILIARSYLSACAALLLVATTQLPDLLRALAWFRIPALLVVITQFLYRYLFVLFDQAQNMRLAARCRTGVARTRKARQSRFQGAAGALSVLFARSYLRAGGIHRAMISRGFTGTFPALAAAPPGWRDFAFLAGAVTIPAIIRVTVT